MSEPLVIALVGISGVGKTTFLTKLSSRLEFQHLTAGSLIRRARDAEKRPRDQLRLADVEENQRLLVEGFDLACDRLASRIILDGHCIIHGDLGVQHIGSQVFSELGIRLMVHLEAPSRQVQVNRSGDLARDRPLLHVAEIDEHQALSLAHAQDIASELQIEFLRLTHADLNVLVDRL
jgi:adenylate kinase